MATTSKGNAASTPTVDPAAHYWVRMKLGDVSSWQVAEDAAAVDLGLPGFSVEAFTHCFPDLGWRVSETYTGFNLVGGMYCDDAGAAVDEAKRRLVATGAERFAQLVGEMLTAHGMSPRFTGELPKEVSGG